MASQNTEASSSLEQPKTGSGESIVADAMLCLLGFFGFLFFWGWFAHHNWLAFLVVFCLIFVLTVIPLIIYAHYDEVRLPSTSTQGEKAGPADFSGSSKRPNQGSKEGLTTEGVFIGLIFFVVFTLGLTYCHEMGFLYAEGSLYYYDEVECSFCWWLHFIYLA